MFYCPACVLQLVGIQVGAATGFLCRTQAPGIPCVVWCYLQVRIKAAISSLRSELNEMEVRIGVVSHTLLHLSLRDKQQALRDVQSAASNGRDTR